MFTSQIALSSDMLINECAMGNASFIVDEQHLPVPKTKWSIDSDKQWIYPISVVIDLGVVHQLTAIHFYDTNGKGLIRVSGGKPFRWTQYFSEELSLYNAWNTQPLSAVTQFIRIEILSPESNFNEIILSGKPLSTQALKEVQLKPKAIPMHQFFGTNSFIDVPMDKIAPLTFIREYHSWNWMEGDGKAYVGFPNNQNQFNPTIAGGGWNFDAFYKQLHEKGYTVCPVLEGSATWLFKKEKVNFQYKPILSDTMSTFAPASYIAHADHLYQFAARYGHQKISAKKLKLASNQLPLSGLGWVSYYENWNEPDKWWEGRRGYFSPYEYAAMSSADYDGHEQSMGNVIGLKNADSSAHLVMSGLATLNLEYLKAMLFWFQHNRKDKRFPFDVINFHHYSNNAQVEGGMSDTGISPEQDSLYEKISRIHRFRAAQLPSKELWITEFGYDDMPKGRQIAPKIGNTSGEEIQARWLIRTYFILLSAGADRAAQFMIRNAEESSQETYSHCGLTKSKENAYYPKLVWHYLYTIKELLQNTYFDGFVREGNVWICKFKPYKSRSRSVYAIWLGTTQNSVVSNFSLTIPKQYKYAKQIELQPNQIKGKVKELTINQNKLRCTISELPLFIEVATEQIEDK